MNDWVLGAEMLPKINCDMGEGFGKYSLADDAAIMPLIDQANIACGFHASDPAIMERTVDLALEHAVEIGAHPSLPDLQGFGRREMKINPVELVSILKYQIGALDGMLRGKGAKLSHIKPHGALYGMACREYAVAAAIADAALAFELPVFGLVNTTQESAYKDKGVSFVCEFFADLDYLENGHLDIVSTPTIQDPELAARRALDAIVQARVATPSGVSVPVRAQTICVHSDNPMVMALIQMLRSELVVQKGGFA